MSSVVARRWSDVYGFGKSEECVDPYERAYLDEAEPAKSVESDRVRTVALSLSRGDKVKCLRCDQFFLSWNKCKNRICDGCRQLNAEDDLSMSYPGFESIPKSAMRRMAEESSVSIRVADLD